LFLFISYRLHVYGVDFRNLTALEWFCSYVISNYDRLDAIVNNAAQTVRRPPAYYAHLVEGEKMLTYTAGFDDSSSSSSSSSGSGGSGRGGGVGGSSSYPSSIDPYHSPESNREQDIDTAGRERVRSVLRHQQRYSSSLSAAVQAAEGVGAGHGTNRIEEIGGDRSTGLTTETPSGVGVGAALGVGVKGDLQGEAKSKSVILTDTEASSGTVSSLPNTRDIQMTPAISSSEMTQIILTKVH
jgi:hypothetical protein